VKNIDVIQLGMHEMDTWYFSPLPPEYKDCKVRRGGSSTTARCKMHTGCLAWTSADGVEFTHMQGCGRACVRSSTC
jgi:hypothetical protein